MSFSLVSSSQTGCRSRSVFMGFWNDKFDSNQLEVRVVEYYDQGRSALAVDPNHDSRALEARILEWGKKEMGKRAPSQFFGAIEAFLLQYLKEGCPEKVSSVLPLMAITALWVKSLIRGAQLSLVELAVKMASMWRILRTQYLLCKEENGEWYRPGLSSLTCYVRRIAQQAMVEAELELMKQIFGVVREGIKGRENQPVVWAVLWMVILIYREALVLCEQYPPSSIYVAAAKGSKRNSRDVTISTGWLIPKATENSSRVSLYGDGFVEVTQQLLDALVVTHHPCFRTKKAQEYLKQPKQDSSFTQHHETKQKYDEARKAMSIFCKLHVPSVIS